MSSKKGFFAEMYNYRKVIPRFMLATIKKKYMPMVACINITKHCNLKCIHCYAALETLKDERDPSMKKITDLVDELYDLGVRWIRLLGGEPLLRKDIGKIIRYIKSKGMAIEVITNGMFIDKYIEDLRLLDILCISIDGGKIEHDQLRGEGTWEEVVKGIDTAVKSGIPTRIHCVLLKDTKNSIEAMSKLSDKYSIPFNFGDCSFEEYPDPRFYLSKEESCEFYNTYLSAKKQGKRVSNSEESICSVINWPTEDNVITYEQVEKNPKLREILPECQFGHKEVFIDIDGMVYPCTRLWKKGVSYKKNGLEKAWKIISESRKCYICKEIGIIERAKSFGGNIKAIVKGYLGFIQS